MKKTLSALMFLISITPGLASAQSAPTVSYTSPSAVKAGETIKVYGENFTEATFVAIDGGTTIQPTDIWAVYSNRLSFTVPESLSPGTHSIAVAEKAGPWDLSAPIYFTVLADEEPKLVLSSDFLTFNYTEGGPKPEHASITLFNQSSSQPITFRIKTPGQPAWLNSGYATETLTLQPSGTMSIGAWADPSKAGKGNHSYKIRLEGEFDGSPKYLTVNFNVSAGASSTPLPTPVIPITNTVPTTSEAEQIKQLQAILQSLIQQLIQLLQQQSAAAILSLPGR